MGAGRQSAGYSPVVDKQQFFDDRSIAGIIGTGIVTAAKFIIAQIYIGYALSNALDYAPSLFKYLKWAVGDFILSRKALDLFYYLKGVFANANLG